ncbi:uncharacterized protein FOMMEDRAFT_92837 [Fomitiporia mediterranea MF3/22]|uniref:uncharacterized protein n=1 Tax=Fomitiporia mediterranea (strain MF3/22) TaxID=694068 RepID=UPI0004408D7C|nr:uncharacterized protein FOMMEDRAFT_92837 [Fomitiporia mediterranea MF3/22]EJC99644.1 hypothetical protein FOMMEDRAFT_92837 [Fomitiporia mediterranea MF3/22]
MEHCADGHTNNFYIRCPACYLKFGDTEALLKHGDEKHFVCWACEKIFTTSDAYAKHNESEHHYCRECDRFFISSQNNLEQHHASSRHTPKLIQCPGRLCGKKFTHLSYLVLHAETGTCPSGITRKDINAFIARYDRENVITNPARMINGPDGTKYPSSEPEYYATERSWNGQAYECFLCRKEFRTLYALNQHLRSPRHLQKMYHCPKRGCNKEFSALSSLCQHVEGGSCGARQMGVVEDVMEYLERGMGLMTV